MLNFTPFKDQVEPARLTWPEYFMQVAFVAAQRSTCVRRAVGCVIVDDKKRVLSTGYNGVPSGAPHCYEVPCLAATSRSGENLDGCKAIHAEINAINQCSRPDDAYTIYCTDSPCDACVDELLKLPATMLVFARQYPHHLGLYKWANAGRSTTFLSEFPFPFVVSGRSR